MENTTQTTNPIETFDWEKYESDNRTEEVNAVKEFFRLY